MIAKIATISVGANGMVGFESLVVLKESVAANFANGRELFGEMPKLLIAKIATIFVRAKAMVALLNYGNFGNHGTYGNSSNHGTYGNSSNHGTYGNFAILLFGRR